MFGLPTHWLFLIDKEGNEENVANLDCSTKQDVRDEVKYIINMYSQHEDTSKYVKAQYRKQDQVTVLYECTIEECLNKN